MVNIIMKAVTARKGRYGEERRPERGQAPRPAGELLDISAHDLPRLVGQHVGQQESSDMLSQARKHGERGHQRERDGNERNEREQGREREARRDLQAMILAEAPEHVHEEPGELSQLRAHGAHSTRMRLRIGLSAAD
jgi:hypothetical protein